jgi:hypothetical protein
MPGVLSGCFGDLLMLKLNLEFALPYRKVSSQDALGSNSMENGERTENMPLCGGVKWPDLGVKWGWRNLEIPHLLAKIRVKMKKANSQ